MNTLEQIVATHPCPIIRGKIMENVDKTKEYCDIRGILAGGFFWHKTKEGAKFCDSVSTHFDVPYSQLKYLDLSYVPEPTTPTPKWLPIDRDNLPSGKALAIDYPAFNDVYYGTLQLADDNRIRLYIGGGSYLYRLTHYIPLSDLLNLPIWE